jgi:hypothetical protein
MPTTAQESAFLDDLLAGVDLDTFTYIPSPDTTPVKSISSRPTKRPRSRSPAKFSSSLLTPTKKENKSKKLSAKPLDETIGNTENQQLHDLLEGADEWDWDDWNTPKKVKSSPVKPKSVKTEQVCWVRLHQY